MFKATQHVIKSILAFLSVHSSIYLCTGSIISISYRLKLTRSFCVSSVSSVCWTPAAICRTMHKTGRLVWKAATAVGTYKTDAATMELLSR